MEQVKLSAENILPYILAGKAIFTIRNPKTDKSFTYKVRASEDKTIHFVSILNGPDNNSSYNYIGVIVRGRFIHGRKSSVGSEAPSVLAFGWLLGHLDKLGPVEVFKSGKCCRCGRLLTTRESVLQGIGPECIKMMG
jgi:hypothetical protein